MRMKIFKFGQREEKKNESHTRTRKSSILMQLLAGCTANLTLINVGLHLGWPAVSLPSLEDEKSEIHVTSSEGAWIVSFLSVGAWLGSVIPVTLVNRIGRKWTLLLTVIPNIGSWTLVYYAKNAEIFFVARFIGGISIGFTFATVPIYIAEIAEKEIRGALGSIIGIMSSFGTILIYVIGPFCSIPILSLLAMLPSLIFMFSFIWMPETPYYYLKKRKYEEAERALIWLREKRDVTLELQEMSNFMRKERCLKGGPRELVNTSGNRWATLIAALTLSAQVLSGHIAIMAYSGLILKGVSDEISPPIVVVANGVVTLIFFIVASFIMDKIGRKPLILFSLIGVISSHFMMGVYFHLRSKDTEDANFFWLPIVSLLSFFAFYAIGLGPVPWVLISETYPINVKSSATMIFSIYASILSWGSCKTYQIVTDQWGEQVIFFTFATIEIIFTFLIILVVFETKGKSFEEIQARLNGTYSEKNVHPNKFKPFSSPRSNMDFSNSQQ